MIKQRAVFTCCRSEHLSSNAEHDDRHIAFVGYPLRLHGTCHPVLGRILKFGNTPVSKAPVQIFKTIRPAIFPASISARTLDDIHAIVLPRSDLDLPVYIFQLTDFIVTSDLAPRRECQRFNGVLSIPNLPSIATPNDGLATYPTAEPIQVSDFVHKFGGSVPPRTWRLTLETMMLCGRLKVAVLEAIPTVTKVPVFRRYNSA